jgi:hypothetical protein
MKTKAEYEQLAQECRALAQTMEREEQRAALIETAEVWEKLARERELTATDAEESAG